MNGFRLFHRAHHCHHHHHQNQLSEHHYSCIVLFHALYPFTCAFLYNCFHVTHHFPHLVLSALVFFSLFITFRSVTDSPSTCLLSSQYIFAILHVLFGKYSFFVFLCANVNDAVAYFYDTSLLILALFIAGAH